MPAVQDQCREGGGMAGVGPSSGASRFQQQAAARRPGAGGRDPRSVRGAQPDPRRKELNTLRPAFLRHAGQLGETQRELENWLKVYQSNFRVSSSLLDEGFGGVTAEKVAILSRSVSILQAVLRTHKTDVGHITDWADSWRKLGDKFPVENLPTISKLAEKAFAEAGYREGVACTAFNKVNFGDRKIENIRQARIARAEMFEAGAEWILGVVEEIFKKTVETWASVYVKWMPEPIVSIIATATFAYARKISEDYWNNPSVDFGAAARHALVEAFKASVDQVVSYVTGRFKPDDSLPEASVLFHQFDEMLKTFLVEFVSRTADGEGVAAASSAALKETVDPARMAKALVACGFGRWLEISGPQA